jgi:hypothetical protein
MARLLRRLALVLAVLLGSTVLVPTAAQAAPSRFDEYYTYFDTGKKWIPFHDTRWVPQGLTKLGENTLVISYYDRSDKLNSRIALIDRVSGRYLRTYNLDVKAHVGGLAMTSKYFWVSEGGHLRRYARSALSGPSGGTLHTQKRVDVKGHGSYVFAEGETLWTGTFNHYHRDWMYQYRVNGNGTLTYLQDRYTPSNVQGVVVTSTRIVWSQSYGRNSDSKLIVWPRSKAYNGSAKIGNWITAPNMSEGMVIAGGEIQVVFESGANAYNGHDDGDAASYIIRSVHHGKMPPLP